MRFRIQFATALLCCGAIIATGRTASAQSQTTSMLRNGAAPATQNAHVEEMPAGQMPPGPTNSGGQSQEYYPSGSGEMSYASSGGCADGYCSSGCDQGCCEAPSCDSATCGSGGGSFCGLAGGQFYFTADYLNVRASFSEATAFVHEDLQTTTTDYVPLEFNFESSYRLGGGYRLCCCGEEIRFLFTRMNSSADEQALPGDIVPYETNPAPNGKTLIHANVDAKTYDIEWAKTIPLGGCCCDSCGSDCGGGCQNGCGSACCGRCCPAWDITWSGGVRIADVDWDRTYARHDANDFVDKISRPEMEFRGGGLRTGLEGRRYFGKDGWLSLYAKGDLSLLFGDVEVTSTERIFDPTTPGTPTSTLVQNFKSRQIIPVTEIEAGLTGQVTCHTAITAGYLMAAWHDLGFRDTPSNLLNTTVFEPATSYDDANILGFDGFFARVEFAY